MNRNIELNWNIELAVNLAVALASKCQLKVGLLDADVYGPNIPIMMNINTKPEVTQGISFLSFHQCNAWTLFVSFLCFYITILVYFFFSVLNCYLCINFILCLVLCLGFFLLPLEFMPKIFCFRQENDSHWKLWDQVYVNRVPCGEGCPDCLERSHGMPVSAFLLHSFSFTVYLNTCSCKTATFIVF